MLTQEVYDAVNAKAAVNEKPPEGLLMHSAGAVDGGFQIVDVWESEEHARRFDTERLGPAIQEVVFSRNDAPSRPPSPVTTVYELHQLILP